MKATRIRGLARRATCAVAASVLLHGCATEGLAFKQDNRLDITAPTQNETVRLPFDVRWDFEGEHPGRFVVFFDRIPMRPGQSLLSLVPEGHPCRSRPACPDEAFLEERWIHVTDQRAVTVKVLPETRTTNRAKDRHELTVVLLDEEGKRLGETAFTREFVIERED